MLRSTNKNKKYALRKIGKYFGPCVIGTMIAIGVAAIPSNEVHATRSEYVPYKVYDVTITPDQPETVYKADDSKDVGYRDENKGTPGKQEIWSKYEKRYYFTNKYPERNEATMLWDLYIGNKNKTLDEDGTIPAHPDWAEEYPDNNGEEFPKRIDENKDGTFSDKDIYDEELHKITEYAERKVESNKKFEALPDTVKPENSDESSVLTDNDDNEVVADYDSVHKVVRLNPHYYEIRNTPKVDTVITLGTKPKVVTEEIPVTTTYTDDPTLEKGKEVVVTEGEAGSKETVTRYTVNKDTGEITETTSVRTTKEMVPRVVKRGTKEAGTVKVAQPTIAIVEESNKASIQVKAPEKDADTVRITYPKRGSSENEVLILKKQPNGEWTLEKQPENVTLDKKTGIVTIPREAVVNKQKVQAQSKNGNSDYTSFVYAVLSIAEANPEHPVTIWKDKGGKELAKIIGKKALAGTIPGYKWVSSRLEDGILTHTFEKINSGNLTPVNLIPEKPSETENPVIRTVWRDENGKNLKTPSVEKQEAGEVEGYEFVESHREGDNLTVHVFRTRKSQTPNPAPSKVSEQKGETVATTTSEKTVENGTSTNESDKAELPNTGTETNASLANAGIMTLLAGLGLGFFKKKEDEN